MKRRVHINAIKNEIDQLFSVSRPLKDNPELAEKIINDGLLPKDFDINTAYYRKPIDFDNKNELIELFENQIKLYLKQHQFNTINTYISEETKRLKDIQEYYFNDYSENRKHKDYYYKIQLWLEFMTEYSNSKALPPQTTEEKSIKYGANEYALTYIFDLYALGKQIPTNRIDGSLDAKAIKNDVCKFPDYDKAPDTFYRAVKKISKDYDINNPRDLQNISKDWLNAVRNLSTNWATTEQYLKDKNLIKE